MRSPQLEADFANGRRGSTETRIRVLFVGAEPLGRDLAVSNEAGIEVVAIAQDGETAVRLARDLAPAVVVIEVELPGRMDGIEAALRIKGERLETGIVVLGSHGSPRYVEGLALTDKPGWTLLLKEAVPDSFTLVRAIQASAGGSLFDAGVVECLRPRTRKIAGRLTPKQIDLLELLAELVAKGYSNQEIAERLASSEREVQPYLNEIRHEKQRSEKRDLSRLGDQFGVPEGPSLQSHIPGTGYLRFALVVSIALLVLKAFALMAGGS